MLYIILYYIILYYIILYYIILYYIILYYIIYYIIYTYIYTKYMYLKYYVHLVGIKLTTKLHGVESSTSNANCSMYCSIAIEQPVRGPCLIIVSENATNDFEFVHITF